MAKMGVNRKLQSENLYMLLNVTIFFSPSLDAECRTGCSSALLFLLEQLVEDVCT